jgi:hypothetical protein
MSPFFACLTGPLASLVLASTLSPVLAQSAPYLGRWAEKPETCSNPTDHSTDDIPITITRRSIETFASSCRILGIDQRGEEVRIRTSCRDEGEMENEPRTPITFTLRLKGNRMTAKARSAEPTTATPDEKYLSVGTLRFAHPPR